MQAFAYLVLSTRNPDPTWMDSDRKFATASEAHAWATEKIRDGYTYVSLTHRDLDGETTIVLHGSSS